MQGLLCLFYFFISANVLFFVFFRSYGDMCAVKSCNVLHNWLKKDRSINNKPMGEWVHHCVNKEKRPA